MLTPLTIYFLVRIKRIIIGSTTMVEAAIKYSEKLAASVVKT